MNTLLSILPSMVHCWIRGMRQHTLNRPLLLIYQMGKVGSQSIEATLQPLLARHIIHRPHFLSPEAAAVRERWREFSCVKPERKASIARHIDEARELFAEVQLRKLLRMLWPLRPRIDVIAGVREPVSLLLASIFQNHTLYFETLEALTPEACRSLLLREPGWDLERSQHMQDLQDFLLHWFDSELKRTFALDVYTVPFPHGAGCQVLQNTHARVLLYRFENLAQLPGMLAEFLPIAPPEIARRNVGSEKEYAGRYAAAQAEMRLPLNFLERQYHSRMVRHFYTSDERQQFIDRWLQCDKRLLPAGARDPAPVARAS